MKFKYLESLKTITSPSGTRDNLETLH